MFVVSAMLVLAAGPSAAADDTIVVKAQRLVDDAAITVEAVDRAVLQAAPDLASALTTSPSIDIVTPGAAGATEIFLRGGDANFTAVTLDGVRLNDVTDSRGGAVDVGAIAPFEVGTASIAKGAISVLEGSDALSGEIALESADPLDIGRATAMIDAGEGGRYSLNGRVVPWRGDKAALSVTGTRFDLGDAPGGQGFTRSSLGAKLAGTAGSGSWSVAARHGETSREAFADASGGNRYAASPELETSEAALSTLSARYGAGDTGGWSPSMAVTWLRRTEERLTPAIPPALPAGASDSEFERMTATGTLTRSVAEDWQALVGVEVAREEGSTEGYLDFGFPLPVDFDMERTTPSLFGEARRDGGDAINSGALDVYAGIRADYIDTEETVPTVRAGAVYRLPGNRTALRASAGTGFKSPSFYALGDPLVGNADLEDERSVTGEIGVNHRIGEATSVDVAAYYAHYTDLIDFDGATFGLVNRSEVDVSGVEATANHTIGAHALSVFAAWTDVDAPEGAVLLRPDWRAGARWHWSADRLSASASWRYRSETEASSVPTGIVTLDASQRLDVVASYALSQGTVVSLTADDLFDSEGEAQPGFTPWGRRIGIRLELAY